MRGACRSFLPVVALVLACPVFAAAAAGGKAPPPARPAARTTAGSTGKPASTLPDLTAWGMDAAPLSLQRLLGDAGTRGATLLVVADGWHGRMAWKELLDRAAELRAAGIVPIVVAAGRPRDYLEDLKEVEAAGVRVVLDELAVWARALGTVRDDADGARVLTVPACVVVDLQRRVKARMVPSTGCGAAALKALPLKARPRKGL